MSPTFAPFDWIVIAGYFAVLVVGGWAFTPRHTGTARDYFLAGGTVPAWLAAVSVLSATQSAATFLGGPDFGYNGEFTYLGTNLGGLLGAIFVARVLIPRFYAARVTTVYELLTQRYGTRATRWAGAMFLVGRVLAGGARLYLAAIAVAMVMTSTVSAQGILIAAALLVAASFLFTFMGGLRSVLWIDLVQFTVFLAAAIAVLVFLRLSIPATNADILHGLTHAPGGIDKLRLFDLSLDTSRPFSLLAIVTGVALLYVGSSGLDQDVTQRLLACRDARTGARSLYASVIATVPVVAIFITIGLLLHIFYDRPELMGGATAAAGKAFGGEKISIFMHYILTELPAGLRGLVTAGIMAAAVATTNSALNAMSSVLIQDFYRPWRERRGGAGEHHYVQAGRAGMGAIGIAMLIVAVLSFYWQHVAKIGLLEFALQVMVFAYAGLLGVFFAAVLTPRGTSTSVLVSLIAGFATITLLQPTIAAAVGLPSLLLHLAFPFQLCIGTAVAFLVAIVPRGAVSRS